LHTFNLPSFSPFVNPYQAVGQKVEGREGGNFLPASEPRRPRVLARSRAEKLPLHILFLRAPIFNFLKERAIFLRGTAAALRRLTAGQRRFRFLDLCIRFGKIISKVCWCFNPAANSYSNKICLFAL
jgi:hypothetical protein